MMQPADTAAAPDSRAASRLLPQMISLPKIHDPRGNLTFVESEAQVPFSIRRCYWIYDVPAGEERGGHSHHHMSQLLVAVGGSFDVNLFDGFSWKRFTLNRPFEGLYIPPGFWRTLDNFSSGAVCLSIVSTDYDESDYVRDFDEYRRLSAPLAPVF